MRYARALTGLVALAAALPACASAPVTRSPVADLAAAERPAPATDEAGVWMVWDRGEEQLKNSPRLVRDPALHEYLRGVVCRLAGPQCDSIRIYVGRYANPLAAMTPNGMLLLHSGIFLRVATEAQLAFILGHEIAHYRRRHAAQRWSEIKSKAIPNFGANLGLGVPALLAFSRDHEREADRLGFELVVKAGYAPAEAPRAWERLTAENASRKTTAKDELGSTHPPDAERLAKLRALAETATAAPQARIGREEYVTAVRSLRHELLGDEVHRRDYAASDIVLRRLIADGESGLGDVHFHLGEVHRLRGNPDDLPEAVADYHRALEHDDAPAETFRSLGLVQLRLGQRAAAREALARYLERVPEARDRDMIKTQLSELERTP